LVLDGRYGCAENTDLIDKAKVNNITMICVPAHITHRLQPVDMTFMGVRTFLRASGRPVTHYNISELLGRSNLKLKREKMS
jgi:hypothetical protein